MEQIMGWTLVVLAVGWVACVVVFAVQRRREARERRRAREKADLAEFQSVRARFQEDARVSLERRLAAQRIPVPDGAPTASRSPVTAQRAAAASHQPDRPARATASRSDDTSTAAPSVDWMAGVRSSDGWSPACGSDTSAGDSGSSSCDSGSGGGGGSGD
jgi:hypothetical protein